MTSARKRRGALAGLAALTATALAVAGCGTDASGGGSSSSGSSSATIQIWEGWTGQEAKTFAHLVSEYEAQHPGQKVQSLYVNNDDTLQKVLTAMSGGLPARHRLPLRLLGAQRRADPSGRRPDAGG